MKNLELKMRNLMRAIFGGVSLTAMAFVFQACYGTGPDDYEDVKFTGTVRSSTTNLPIEGVIVTVNNEGHYKGITDKDGKFDFYADVPYRAVYGKDDTRCTPDKVMVQFLDVDGNKNGMFADTTLFVNTVNKKEIIIDLQLTEMQ